MNIASTKSILLHAEAGHIIESFGELVVGGNLVVGLVVFLIITTVQFIVIAKGSERVAEVGARFTLDAMPGKQMSIDADLRGGNLTADEARRKRARLAMESQLHGGMDGAMKFVKGDAIAGLVITMVNILAGIVVGVTYHGMTAGEAANRFAILSVGDAMVSQIASLLISVAAGVMITRVANENETRLSSLGLDIGRQLTSNARALMAASVLLACFAFVPGFPAVLFLLLAAAVGAGGYTIWRKQRDISGTDQRKLPSTSRKGAKGEAPHIRKNAPDFASPLSMRLSPQLANLLDPARLDQAIESERRKLVELLGLPFPGIAIWQSESLQDMQYEVLIHDVPETRAELGTPTTCKRRWPARPSHPCTRARTCSSASRKPSGCWSRWLWTIPGWLRRSTRRCPHNALPMCCGVCWKKGFRCAISRAFWRVWWYGVRRKRTF